MEIGEQIIAKLKNTLSLQDHERNAMIELMEHNADLAKESRQTAALIYHKLRENGGLIKCHRTAIPDGILPSGVAAKLLGFKIAKNVDIYKKEKWVWRYVPRGMTLIEVSSKTDQNKNFLDVAIYANRKFYNLEDETNLTIRPLDQATDILCVEKLDGDGAHFTIRLIEGVFYVIGGSKNVHIIFKNCEDIERYDGRRFKEAKQMAKGILSALNKMSESQFFALNELLNTTKMTVVCEVLQFHHQHIVDILDAKTDDEDENKIFFLMFCQTATTREVESLTAFPPHLGLTLAKAFNFSIPKFFHSDTKRDINFLSNKIRKMNHTEGYVAYFVQGNNTIALKKVKTMWNIMLHTLRENAKTHRKKKISTEEKQENIQKRFLEKQNKYKFNNDYRQHWEILAIEFLKYMDNSHLTSEDMTKRFPFIWSKFLEESGHTDVFLFIGMQQCPTHAQTS